MQNSLNNIKLKNIPGSVYPDKRTGKLIVKVKGKRWFSGLGDTPQNRKHCERKKELMYYEACGLIDTKPQTTKKIFELFEIYQSERKITRAYKTIVSDTTAFNNFFPSNISAKPETIENAIKDYLKSTKISDESKNIYMRTIQTFLNWLYDNNYINEKLNLKKKYFIKTTDSENKIFSKDEIKKIINYFNDKDIEFSYLFKLLVLTGLRIGEALNLEWKNINKDRIELSNKIKKTNEFVLITDDVREILTSLKKFKNEKVFRWKPSSYSRLNRRFTQALIELNIDKDGRSFHEFRKSYLFFLQRNNIPVNVAQKLMRHQNINVTIKHYQRNETSELYKATSILNNYFD